MSSGTEKILNNAMNVFNAKLADRQVIKLEGMEDYLKVPQYKALVNLEKRASQLELDATKRIMDTKIAYLKAAQELRACERRWFEEIQQGMESLEERNKIVKDVNMMMRKSDYSLLQPARPAVAAPESVRKAETKPPLYRIN
ncbi:hypothetical protein PMAYCL1PPCAC_14695 [Pristionchus mayeri]|uniref:Uncharacterized protein n=1 Tax=Pristionchus mayeri TaxID=1317129 RepID=A0AAN4ZUX8_9BILA|nr:hypothetical protein PMAYCL1PPCAC_14695 [Pristionchus mayeri]